MDIGIGHDMNSTDTGIGHDMSSTDAGIGHDMISHTTEPHGNRDRTFRSSGAAY